MDCRALTGDLLDLSDFRFGPPQRAGLLTVVPITGRHVSHGFLPLGKRSRGGKPTVIGSTTLQNDSESDCLLAPLHFGRPTDRNSSRILSKTVLVPCGKRLELGKDMVFPYHFSRRICFDLSRNYILPLALRGPAWRARLSSDVSRLTPEINALQTALSRHGLGTLSTAVQAKNAELNTYSRRIELQTGQTGALFFIQDRPVGLEIGPSPAYFEAIWQPLLIGCYGLTALLRQHELAYAAPPPEPYAVSGLADLRAEMFRVRHQRQEQLEAALAGSPAEAFVIEEGQHWQNFRVRSLTGTAFAGQVVEETLDGVHVDGASAMPRMLQNLFRKGTSPTQETIRRRVVYISLFALTVP